MTIKNVDVETFKTQLENLNDVQVVDVRTPAEWETGIIEGSFLINIQDHDFQQQIAKLDKAKPVMVYCRSGGRSTTAANILNDMGFVEIYNLNGGITAWENAGNEVIK